jgi:tRNA(Ile)-lysidine synthase
MTTVIDALAAGLASIPVDTPLCVGLSGGLDSVVLLHGLAQLAPENPMRALHVNHQLSRSADQWQQRCAGYCASLKVDFTATKVDVARALKKPGFGVEATARELRYQAFATSLGEAELLLLAHHLDDQLETLLLRLMRGAGVAGLSAIPAGRDVGSGRLLRPLLGISREQLLDYGLSNGLAWVEDDSNSDNSFDRNFCRHEVLPVLAKRWPNYRESWSKSLQLIAEAAEIVDELAGRDVDVATVGHSSELSLPHIRTLSEPRQRSALRHWLSRIEAPELGWQALNDLIGKLKAHEGSGQTLSVTPQFQLVAYRHRLHALHRRAKPLQPPNNWSMASAETFVLPDNGELILHLNGGFSKCLADLRDVSVRYRQGGETCKIKGRPTKSLKQLFQEAAVPPWLRDRVPLIYCGDELMCIPTIGANEAFCLPKQDETLDVTVIWRQPVFNWFVTGKSD